MTSRRFCLICTLSAILFALAPAGVLWANRAPPPPTVRSVTVEIESDPPQATVFSGGRSVGITPVRIELLEGEQRLLKLVRKGCRDSEVTADAGALGAQTSAGQPAVLLVKMESSAPSTLEVVTQPAGSDVFLDGQRMGVTPLSLRDVAPGAHALRLTHPDCYPLSENIAVGPGASERVERTLQSRMVALYREMIRKEPAMLSHYGELAHHYVIRGEFQEAGAVLMEGVVAAKLPGASDQNRFFDEIWRIHSRYFIYPPETKDNQVRPLTRAAIQKAESLGAWSPRSVANYLKQMDQYDAGHPAPK